METKKKNLKDKFIVSPYNVFLKRIIWMDLYTLRE